MAKTKMMRNKSQGQIMSKHATSTILSLLFRCKFSALVAATSEKSHFQFAKFSYIFFTMKNIQKSYISDQTDTLFNSTRRNRLGKHLEVSRFLAARLILIPIHIRSRTADER